VDNVVQSPAWWRELLLPRLETQARTAEQFQRYYDGVHPDFGVVTDKYRETFGRMLGAIVDNWMQLVVDAESERMIVNGFRIGEDPAGDEDAHAMWQASFMDADSDLAHTTAITCERAFALVAPPAKGEKWSKITVEHPSQVIVACDPGDRRRRLAALKRWKDEWTGEEACTLYLPDGLYRWRQSDSSAQWREVEGDPNPFGEVPMVPLINRPNLFGGGRSELANVTSTQDQINKLVCDMIVASEFQAFRQRWATGVEVAMDETTGEDKAPFKAAVDRLWATPDSEAKFGEFGSNDLKAYVTALENRIQSLASRSRTPPHYLLGGMGQFPSGESLKATETGLIAKVKSQRRHFGESWEEVIRLGFKAQGDARADAMSAETIWADPESRTESEHVDSLVKKLSIGVPMPQLWEDAGYTPEQIARFKTMMLEEALNRAVAGTGVDPMPAEPAPAVETV